jgi:hypothetical protein
MNHYFFFLDRYRLKKIVSNAAHICFESVTKFLLINCKGVSPVDIYKGGEREKKQEG